MLWLCILLLLQYVQSEYAESGWIKTWPLPGTIIDFFYVFSVLMIISCVFQWKKISIFKWANFIKTEKYQYRLSRDSAKMIQAKNWEEPDLMEYDLDKMEIRVLNKNPHTYPIPLHWEDTLVKVGDNLYYGFLTVNSKEIIIPFRFEN